MEKSKKCRLFAVFAGGVKTFALLLALLLTLLFLLQDAMMFHPNHDRESHRQLSARPGFEAVEFTSNGRTWHGFLRKSTSAQVSPLVIFFYGNAMNASSTMRFMDRFGIWPYFLDYHCLIVDYAGYGPGGKGRPTVENMYEMALAAFDFAQDLPSVSGIIAGGFSIGTAPAAYLASRRELDGLFLLSPFASAYDLYNSVLPIFHGPMRLLVRRRFLPEQYARSITVPVLLVASRNDEIIPFASPQRLNSHFAGETTFIALSGVGHNEVLFNRTSLESIRAFLETIAPP